MERSIRGMLHVGSNKWLEINSILFFLIEIFKGSLRIIIVQHYLLLFALDSVFERSSKLKYENSGVTSKAFPLDILDYVARFSLCR